MRQRTSFEDQTPSLTAHLFRKRLHLLIRYVGRLFVKANGRPTELEDGDIICFLKSTPVESSEQCCYPDVPSFLEYVHSRQRNDYIWWARVGPFSLSLVVLVLWISGDIIKTLKENENEYTWGNVTVKLAESCGFCWGVERAVQIAYRARKHFAEEKIWITNEIIHNPTVNKRLEEMEVQNIPINDGSKQFDVVDKGGVVVLPAFGAAVEEMMALSDKKVQIVDTTCPWLMKVWNTVEKHKKGGQTSIIHGKYSHEETIATASFAGKYISMKNMAEMLKFAVTKGFDPNTDLVKVGIANQTTLLKGGTEEIGKLADKTMMCKYGVENVNEHFISFNTICDATQERHDAMYKLVEQQLDLMLVIGGWNSSTMSHLQEIAEDRGIPSY
ncbi:hypothetical protein RHSIM_Rhsim03G0115600 [Rhododendron simsii]|uniref:4-hydroxy-3-methylbut-2-enyl diphosphate reductase n=1 Tax=Rhododendron simsii TaxID=118357 RepID=A0A834HAB8_RHOSS|nr:hypothetical protein RHSIM_Rhsim03G0115600 [Rhododendron simsii]